MVKMPLIPITATSFAAARRSLIDELPCFFIECKNHTRLNLSGWISELLTEIGNAGGVAGVLVHKKRGTTDAADQYATLPFGMLVQLLKEAGYK